MVALDKQAFFGEREKLFYLLLIPIINSVLISGTKENGSMPAWLLHNLLKLNYWIPKCM